MRSYEDACGITRALDAVGERWALPVVRELVFGPRRYTDLAAALPGVSTNILSARLRELTDAGVLSRRRLPPPAGAAVYELSPWGAALEPALIELGRWAAHTPIDMERQAFSASSLALSLKTTFDPVAAAGVDAVLRLAMADDVFDARIDDRGFAIERATGSIGADAAAERRSSGTNGEIRADPKTLAALVYQRLDPAKLTARGAACIDGPPGLVETFARCFALPQPPREGPP